MVPPPDEDDAHDCGWKAYAKAQASEQQVEIADLKAQIAALTRIVLGKKSERQKSSKLPPPLPPFVTKEKTAAKRSALAALRDAQMETEIVDIPVPPDGRACPSCASDKLRAVGNGKPSITFEYVQPHFRKRIHRRETLACRCGTIVTAPPPPRAFDQTRYAPSFIAHVIVSKCADSIPQYRLERAYRLLGIPMARSTMCELFHKAARELRPLHTAALAWIKASPDVHADETSVRQQDKSSRSFMWDFVTSELVVYEFASSRSGETPKKVLAHSKGRLVVDQHTGYNAVTGPDGRTRAGCLAHARRRIFEAREHGDAKEALALIAAIYVVEREAKDAEIVGTDAHLALRIVRSRPLFARLLRWARRHRDAFEPRSLMGKATRYLLRHRKALGCFLRFVSIPPDNNAAEAGLRRVALGRSNYLFVGHKEAGENLAVLYTLVASCEKNGVNPYSYLADVLLRIQSHPRSKIDELLPHKWKPGE